MTTDNRMPGAANDPPRSSAARADPGALLEGLPVGTRDWKRVLRTILNIHNHEHRIKPKGVGDKTAIERQRFLFSFFGELRAGTRFNNLDPRQLANRHIEAMVARWLARRLATGTIHVYLSYLRTFAEWIGKPGMVREPEFYVGAESPHAHRSEVATEDRSWTAMNIDIAAKIAEISVFDPWVGLQLELEVGFGLRGKEARHLRPHGAIVARDVANPRDAAAFPECRTFLRISAGSKGGRPRDIPILTDAQQELLDRVITLVPLGGFVGRPGFTSLQNQARFYYVIRKCGISKAGLGVVSHGLRHQYANDFFEADAGGPSPVRGGTSRPHGNKPARKRVARVLGHNRERASTSYLGSSAAMRGKPHKAARVAESEGPTST